MPFTDPRAGTVSPVPWLSMRAVSSRNWKGSHIYKLCLTKFRSGGNPQGLCILSWKELEGNKVEAVAQAF